VQFHSQIGTTFKVTDSFVYVFRLCSITLSANIIRNLISKEDGIQASSVTIGDP